MAEAWGAEFLCQKKRKQPHNGNFYFFDSKPDQFECPYCQDGTLMKSARILDMGKNGAAARWKKARLARVMPIKAGSSI